MLAALREQLVPLVAAIGASGRKPKAEILERQYAVKDQEEFAKRVAARCGFDFKRGRLDVTVHPFCTNNGPHDTRITTRYDERHFPARFLACCMKQGMGFTIRDCERNVMDCRQARRCRWEFMNRNRGCGKILWAEPSVLAMFLW